MPILDGSEINKNDLINKINDLGVNDGNAYYVIDLSKLDNLTLNYGSGSSSDDKYIINEESHVIYYYKGVRYDGEMYHTSRRI